MSTEEEYIIRRKEIAVMGKHSKSVKINQDKANPLCPILAKRQNT